MNRKLAVALSGSVAFLAACSDSPVAPDARVRTSGVDLALLEQPNVNQGEFKVCSANASASFSVTFADALGNRLSPPLASTGSPTTLNVAAGTCAIIWSKTTPTTTPADIISSVTIVQTGQAAGYEFQMVEVLDAGNLGSTGDNATKTAVLKSNAFHGATATFTQRLIPPPPPTGCTYTKGWYRNNGANTITGVDGISISWEGQIFAATPGKPGNVAWNGGNDLLNLYQQLLAALENGGANGPNATKQAIIDAQAGTSVALVNGKITISTTLDQTGISNLINALSDFNEGTLAGWPHC